MHGKQKLDRIPSTHVRRINKASSRRKKKEGNKPNRNTQKTASGRQIFITAAMLVLFVLISPAQSTDRQQSSSDVQLLKLTPQQICKQTTKKRPWGLLSQNCCCCCTSKRCNDASATATDVGSLTPIQRACGVPQRSQQRKHPRPTNQAKSQHLRPHQICSQRWTLQQTKIDSQGSGVHRSIFLHKWVERWVRQEGFVAWQLKKAFLLTAQKFPVNKSTMNPGLNIKKTQRKQLESFMNKRAPCFKRSNRDHLLEVRVVKDQRVGSPGSLEARSLLVASSLHKIIKAA